MDGTGFAGARGHARSHRDLTLARSGVVLATQGGMEVGALAQVLLGIAVGSRRLGAAVGMGMRRQYNRCRNGGCSNDREEIEVHLG